MNEPDNDNFCNMNPMPRPCMKNLGLKRVDMPQINSKIDFEKLQELIKHKLNLRSKHEDLNVNKAPIYASQKEVNMRRAKDIMMHMLKRQLLKNPRPNQTYSCSRPRPDKIPVILLKEDNQDRYMVVDGHHRWLAHHLARQKPNPLPPHRNKMWSYVINGPKGANLMESFHAINDTLKKDNHLFHKRHRFNTNPTLKKTKKAKSPKKPKKPKKNKTKKNQ
tara:strand:+ start:491 stop:1150 length:660 start_codon:yes stop_codon:yes gene_type:complete